MIPVPAYFNDSQKQVTKETNDINIMFCKSMRRCNYGDSSTQRAEFGKKDNRTESQN